MIGLLSTWIVAGGRQAFGLEGGGRSLDVADGFRPGIEASKGSLAFTLGDIHLRHYCCMTSRNGVWSCIISVHSASHSFLHILPPLFFLE